MLNNILFEGAATVTPASGVESLAWLLIALPLAGAAILLLLGKSANSWGHSLATLMSWSSCLLGLAMLMSLLNRDASERVMSSKLYTWIDTANFTVDIGLRVDPLSMSFVMLVTFVGSLIHVYSVGYMSHDPERRRFFAYLNLFVASMLLLVLADNFLLLYVGWEGVGVASYLLIGFWNWNPPYASAANKAFIVNRVGDVGMALAIAGMFAVFGSVSYDTVLAGVRDHGAEHAGWMTFIALMLLLAACGKSAQFPLHSWLGDAMAGPTPVSALIHAATMVTAGVYLVVRSGPIFEASPDAQLVVCVVGAITLTYGAIVGCAKDDIKKALAASTMSQIGYMMLAAGLGPIAYGFAIFHLITHGFFKAGMFLGAGSVMHGMNDNVNMREFGALAGKMKVTWITFACGWLAIIGFPLLSGFWSKDKIIEAAFVAKDGAEWQAWVFGPLTVLVAGMTAFYMSRLFFMTFHGVKRWNDDAHPHESPNSMTIPMIVLAIGSVFLGGALALGDGFVHWLEPVLGKHEHLHPVLPIPVIMAITMVVVAIGVAIAWFMYVRSEVSDTASDKPLAVLARNDLFQDEVNDSLFIKPTMGAAAFVADADRSTVDGAVYSGAKTLSGVGSFFGKMQSGFVRSYAASMTVGALAILCAILVWR